MRSEHGAAHLIDGGDDRVGSGTTLPKPTDRFPQPRRIGCVNGCEGYGHDENCDMAIVVRRLSPTGPCSLDYRCKTLSISVLADPAYPTCPCSTGEDR